MLIAGQLVPSIARALVPSISVLARVLTSGVIVHTLVNIYTFMCTPNLISLYFATFTAFAVVDEEEPWTAGTLRLAGDADAKLSASSIVGTALGLGWRRQ